MSKHIHRVGSLTFGLTLIVTGALYIASLYFDVIRPETVMQLWPAVLIALGLEILASLARDAEFVYDKAAIAMTGAVLLFSMILGCVNMACTRWAAP